MHIYIFVEFKSHCQRESTVSLNILNLTNQILITRDTRTLGY